MIRFSEYRALTYALANDSSVNSDIGPYTSNDSLETYQHVEKKYSMVCYYVSPSRSSPQDRLYPSKIDAFLCSHIIVSFASLDGNSINFVDKEVSGCLKKANKTNFLYSKPAHFKHYAIIELTSYPKFRVNCWYYDMFRLRSNELHQLCGFESSSFFFF